MSGAPTKCISSGILALLLSLHPFVSRCEAQDWLGFHGLDRQGVASEIARPIDSSDALDTAWKTPVTGFGYSSPVVVKENIYLTTAYETYRGKKVRDWISFLNQTLSWALLAIAGLVGVCLNTRASERRWHLPRTGRTFLLTGIALIILGSCVFGERLFHLDSSTLRSWKVGTAVSFGSFFMLVLLMPGSKWTWNVFGVLAILLGLAAYAFLPQREVFLDWRSSAGIICTSVILLPALAGCAALACAFRRPRITTDSTTGVANEKRSIPFFRLGTCWGLSGLFATGVFGGLAWRMISDIKSWIWHPPDKPGIEVDIDPVLGWPFVAFSGLLALLAVVIGSALILRHPHSALRLSLYGATTSISLGLTCFLWFVVFPLKREMAHATVCIDKTTGSVRWLREVGYGSTISDFKTVNSHATPTIAAGADHFCAYFGSVGMFGMDHSGKVSWRTTDAEFHSPYGIGHSPVVADGIVILANENERSPDDKSSKSHIVAYDLDSGRRLWFQQRDRSQPRSAGFSTPIVRTIKGKKTIIMRGWDDLTAYDLHTGQVQWTHQLKHRSKLLVASLVADDKYIYVLDGVGVRALDLDALAERRDPVAWLAPAPAEKVSSPVLVDSLLFFATDTGVAFCVDVDQKKVVWREKLGSRFFSSAVAHGDNIIFVDELGKVSIVHQNPTFTLVGQMELGEKVYATPVPQADGLLIRGTANLFYIKPSRLVSGGTSG